MTKRNYNRFNMTGSCTECNESACASSSRSNGAYAAQSTNNALLLTMDTVIAVSIFVALSALVSIIGSIAVIIISAIIIILSAVIICVITPAEYRPNKALEPLI